METKIKGTWMVVICLSLTQMAIAQTKYVWSGVASNGNWHTAGNWTNNAVPADHGNNGDEANIFLPDATVWLTNQASSVRNLQVSGGDGISVPVLNIKTNLSVSYTRINLGSVGGYTNQSGVINHTSGTVTLGPYPGTVETWGNLQLAANTAASPSTLSNNATYNFGGAASSAPKLYVRSTVSIGGRVGEKGVFSLSGYGTFVCGGSIYLGIYNGDAELRIQGGNLSISIGRDLRFGDSGGGNPLLKVTLDATGLSTINVASNVVIEANTGWGGNQTRFNFSMTDDAKPVLNTVYTIIDAGRPFIGNYTNFEGVAHGALLTNTTSRGKYIFQAQYDYTTDYTFKVKVVGVPPPPGTMIRIF